ncbi:hypothetical protein, partial [Staphylococcus aureus]|uniref:hypothetical protein n=1 Tax=Staphylococcus aureus TaxID=1280 RepID=UPI001C502725
VIVPHQKGDRRRLRITADPVAWFVSESRINTLVGKGKTPLNYAQRRRWHRWFGSRQRRVRLPVFSRFPDTVNRQ